MKIKNHAKFIISTMVVITMLFSVMVPLLTVLGEDNKYTEPSSMLYFKNTNSGPLMQKVTLEKGETYYFSFGISYGAPSFTLALKDNSRQDITFKPTLVSKTEKDRYDLYKYSITIPAENDKVYVGLSFATGKEGYVFDFNLEKSGDSTHTNIFKNGQFATYLDNWVWGTDANFVSTGTGKNKTEFSNSFVTLKIKAFDKKTFPERKNPEPKKDQMLYFNAKTEDLFSTGVKLVPGSSYNLFFSLTSNAECSIVALDNKENKLSVKEKAETLELKGKYTNYKYAFTVPTDTDTDQGSNTATVTIGFKFPKGTEGYLFNIILAKSDDEGKKQIITNGDLKSGLDYWCYGSSVKFIQGEKGLGLTKYDGTEAKLEVSDYDETKFSLKSIKDKMLYFKAKTADQFMTRLSLIPGATYTYTFTMTNNVTDFSVIGKNDSRNTVAVGVELKYPEKHEKYNVYTYSLTIPETLNTDAGNGKALVFVGIAFSNGAEGYLINAKLEKSDDASHVNLISNSDFKSGLNNWTWGYNWFVNFPGQKGFGIYNFEDTSVYLQVMDYDESKFTLEAPKDKMLYFDNASSGPLTQRVVVEKGAKYYYSFYVSRNVVGTKISAKTNDSPARKEMSINAKLLEKVEEGKHTYYKYEFTIPQTFKTEEGKTTNFAFIGVSFITGYDGYFYKAKLEKADDNSHKQMLSNADFKTGLDYWDWDYSWFINFPSQLGFGRTEYTTKGSDVLKVMDFDETVFSTEAPDIPLSDHRMLYYRNGANPTLFALRVACHPGKKYILTYSCFSTDNVSFAIATDGDRNSISAKPEMVGEPVDHGNYSTYTYQFTVPAGYSTKEKFIFVGVKIPYYAEGYIFDMSCYLADDKNKTELYTNPGFMKDLDGWIWGWDAWFGLGGNWQPSGMITWTNGIGIIKVMDFNTKYFDELIADINKDDGVWWSEKDYSSSQKADAEKSVGTATLKGTFFYGDNQPVVKRKMILRSDENEYITTTDNKGTFEFKNIIAGKYEIYSVNNDGEEVFAGFYESIEDYDILNVALISTPDDSGVITEGEYEDILDTQDYDDEDGNASQKEKLVSFSGTVYTPQLETVSDLKLYLNNFGKVKTDSKGQFEFNDVPEGEYELYTILPNKQKYVFRTVTLKASEKLAVKLRYDATIGNEENSSDNNTTVIILISSIAGGVLLLGAGGAGFVLIRKRKLLKTKR